MRVWTAACATGEEAYSLALLACEAFAPARRPCSILATDISADALARARAGQLPRALGCASSSPALRARYLREEGERPRRRRAAARARHVRAAQPRSATRSRRSGEAPFDLILCRNVLIYFDGETVGRVLDVLRAARAPRRARSSWGRRTCCARARAGSRGRRRARAVAARRARADAAPPARPAAAAARRPASQDPHDAAGYFLRGLAELESNDPAAAVTSLRRALYVEPDFGLAAFKLGGAHEALGDVPAARRAYEQALRALEPHARHEPFLGQIDLADVATATQARLDVLAAATGCRSQWHADPKALHGARLVVRERRRSSTKAREVRAGGQRTPRERVRYVNQSQTEATATDSLRASSDRLVRMILSSATTT